MEIIKMNKLNKGQNAENIIESITNKNSDSDFVLLQKKGKQILIYKYQKILFYRKFFFFRIFVIKLEILVLRRALQIQFLKRILNKEIWNDVKVFLYHHYVIECLLIFLLLRLYLSKKKRCQLLNY